MTQRLFTYSSETNVPYSFDVDDNLTLHIIQKQKSISYLYATMNGENVNLPLCISVLEYEESRSSVFEYENPIRKFIIEPEFSKNFNEYIKLPQTGKNYCKLGVNRKYEIRCNNKTIINLDPQPCWLITSKTTDLSV
jgi:hypothetical protein